MRRLLALVLLAVAALAGCTHGTSRQPVRLDDGALVVTPVEATSPPGRDVAARVLASQSLPSAQQALTPVLASVSASLPPGSPVRRLRLPLAWVYLGTEHLRFAPSCPMVRMATTPPPPHASHAWALLVDARTGAAYSYAGAGTGACGPSAVPRLTRASLNVSIPFTVERPAPLRIRETFDLPACGHLWGGSASMALASVDTGPCHGSPSKQVVVTYGRLAEKPHARLGLVCYGLHDAKLGAPADCVAPA